MDSLSLVLALVFSAAIIILMWSVKGLLLRPVKGGKNVGIKVLITVDGHAPSLEHTAAGLKWLRSSGWMRHDVLIVDRGMDPETFKIADRLSASEDFVLLMTPQQAANYITWGCSNGGTEQLHTNIRNG